VRAYAPALRLNDRHVRLLRETEHDRLSGAPFFALGCTLAIGLARTPAVAVTALLFLNLGDLAASIVGVAYGGGTLKLGRNGKKSLEGSAAMFVTCFTLGYLAFWDVRLAEYVAAAAALAATLVELYEPLNMNDNLSIPVVSVLALDWALARIQSCPR